MFYIKFSTILIVFRIENVASSWHVTLMGICFILAILLVECVCVYMCVMEALHQLTLIWYTGRFENIGSMFFWCRRIYFVFLCVWMLFSSITKLSILFHVRLYVVVVIRSSDRVMGSGSGVDVPSFSLSLSLPISIALKIYFSFAKVDWLFAKRTAKYGPLYCYVSLLSTVCVKKKLCSVFIRLRAAIVSLVVQHVRWCWRWYTIIKISLWFLHYMYRIRAQCIEIRKLHIFSL